MKTEGDTAFQRTFAKQVVRNPKQDFEKKWKKVGKPPEILHDFRKDLEKEKRKKDRGY